MRGKKVQLATLITPAARRKLREMKEITRTTYGNLIDTAIQYLHNELKQGGATFLWDMAEAEYDERQLELPFKEDE